MLQIGDIVKVIDEKIRFYPKILTDQSYCLTFMDDGYGNSDIWCGVTGLNDSETRYDSIKIFELDKRYYRREKINKIIKKIYNI